MEDFFCFRTSMPQFNSSMTAFFVSSDIAEGLVLDHERAIQADDMHITLIYFGEVAELGEIDKEALVSAVREYAVAQEPVTAKLSGIGRFANVNDDGESALYYSIDSIALREFREGLLTAVADIAQPKTKRDYTPHITLTYLREDEEIPSVAVPDVEITFNTLYLTWGEERMAFPVGEQQELFSGRNTMKPQFMRAFPVIEKNRAEELLKDTTLPIPFVASTPGKKRDGHDLKTEDWDLARYEDYGPVLYGHDYAGVRSLPIGVGGARIEDGVLKIDVQYDTDDEFAMKVRNKAIKGMMAGSVSWDRVDNKNELIEFSNVNIGLDPASLPEIQRAGMRALQLDIMRTLDDEDDDGWDKLIDQLAEKLGERMPAINTTDSAVFIPSTWSNISWDGTRTVISSIRDNAEGDEIDDEPEATIFDELQERAISTWEVSDAVWDELKGSDGYDGYVEDVLFEDGRLFVVIKREGTLYRMDVVVTEDESIILGAETEVEKKVTYTPVEEEMPGSRGDDEPGEEDNGNGQLDEALNQILSKLSEVNQ